MPVDSDKQIKEPIWLTHDSSDEQLCESSLHSSISKRKEERDWFYHSRPAENLKDTPFATRCKQHAQYRFLRPCWFVSLVGLRQLSFPCHFFWVYLNVGTCNSFSALLARVLRFGFCLISLGYVVFFILRHSWVWQIPIRWWAPLFALNRIIYYVNAWSLCLHYYLYSKVSDFCFTANLQYFNTILL